MISRGIMIALIDWYGNKCDLAEKIKGFDLDGFKVAAAEKDGGNYVKISYQKKETVLNIFIYQDCYTFFDGDGFTIDYPKDAEGKEEILELVSIY